MGTVFMCFLKKLNKATKTQVLNESNQQVSLLTCDTAACVADCAMATLLTFMAPVEAGN